MCAIFTLFGKKRLCYNIMALYVMHQNNKYKSANIICMYLTFICPIRSLMDPDQTTRIPPQSDVHLRLRRAPTCKSFTHTSLPSQNCVLHSLLWGQSGQYDLAVNIDANFYYHCNQRYVCKYSTTALCITQSTVSTLGVIRPSC